MMTKVADWDGLISGLDLKRPSRWQPRELLTTI